MLEEIQAFLKENGIRSTLCYAKRDNMYQLSVPKSQLSDLFNLLYKDANFYIKRKYIKFDHYVNTEVTQLIDEYRNAQKVNANDSNNPSKSAELLSEDEKVRHSLQKKGLKDKKLLG
jgi:hypothetical protein